jgi:hypothetical protein
MPRSWSYRKYDNKTSSAQRLKNPPANLTLYTVILVLVACFFLSFMAYNVIRTGMHPPKEGQTIPSNEPKDD